MVSDKKSSGKLIPQVEKARKSDRVKYLALKSKLVTFAAAVGLHDRK